MAIINYGEATAYLRIEDFNPNRNFIDDCIESAETAVFEEANISPQEWEWIDGNSTIREIMRVAVLYSIGWFYEHGKEDQHDLRLTLRNLLFDIRKRKLWK